MVPAAEQLDYVHLVLRGENDLADGEVEVLRQISPPPSHDNGGGDDTSSAEEGSSGDEEEIECDAEDDSSGALPNATRTAKAPSRGHGSGQLSARAQRRQQCSAASAATPAQTCHNDGRRS